MNCTCGMSHEDAQNIFEPLKFSIEGCLSIAINVFGFFTNSMVGYVLLKKESKSLFNKTLFMLTIFDILFNISDILETIRLVHYDKESCLAMQMLQEAHLYLVPQFLRPLRTFAVVTSMYTTVMIAFDRYFAVSKPLMSFVERDDDNWKSVAKKMAPILAISTGLVLPQCFEFYTESRCVLCIDDRQYQDLNETTCLYEKTLQVNDVSNEPSNCPNLDLKKDLDVTEENENCYIRSTLILRHNDIRINKTYIILYINVILNIITYVIPLTLLFVLNWMIYKHLKRRRDAIKQMCKLK